MNELDIDLKRPLLPVSSAAAIMLVSSESVLKSFLVFSLYDDESVSSSLSSPSLIREDAGRLLVDLTGDFPRPLPPPLDDDSTSTTISLIVVALFVTADSASGDDDDDDEKVLIIEDDVDDDLTLLLLQRLLLLNDNDWSNSASTELEFIIIR